MISGDKILSVSWFLNTRAMYVKVPASFQKACFPIGTQYYNL
jgi:hypothetical protein